MRRNMHFIVPSVDFELDMENIESETTLYQWGTNTAIRRFCKTCGILPFYTPRISPDSVAITLGCVDFEASGTPPIEIQTFDGVHWEDSIASCDNKSISDSTASSYQSILIGGDGDVWSENKFQNSISGEQKTYFRSKNTEKTPRVCGMPPNRTSKIVGSSMKGDGDVWVEKKFQNSITGEQRTYYCSKNTPKKVRDEPPSGASKVVTMDTHKEGDRDVWVEKRFQNSTTGKRRSFFCSKNTGRKVRDEPPTGASKVVYL